VVPNKGWVYTIRTLLGMTGKQLGSRCGVSKQRIVRLESDEVLKKTTLETLDKVANQLGCRLVYAIVPKDDLLKMIENQAEKKAIERLSNISHTMALEDQKISTNEQIEQIEILKDELIRNNIKAIWE